MSADVASEKKNDTVYLVFPPIAETDPFYQQKKNLLSQKNLPLEFPVSLSDIMHLDRRISLLENLIQAARIINLDENELYFMGDDHCGSFSTRSELESLNLVISLLNSAPKMDGHEKIEHLQQLKEALIERIVSVDIDAQEDRIIRKCNSGPEYRLLQWAENEGVKSKLQIAEFDHAGRGAFAAEDIDIGQSALEIPQSLLVSEEHVRESEMYRVLEEIEGMEPETLLLLWSMSERHNPLSKFKVYFDSLPREFRTGLSFGLDALAALEGTLLLEEIMQAREHLREQYESLCPSLCAAFPEIFTPECYTWENFLWACELWYSNSMKVIFSDGKLRTCLVPVAGFLNHSLSPHILHFGKVDVDSKVLKFYMSRPCRSGKQCYLSYGSLSGSHLVTFYGFLPKGENPYDTIPLDIDSPEAVNSDSTPWSTHMVRGAWFSQSNKLQNYGLPLPLLRLLRNALLGNDTTSASQTQFGIEVDKDGERTVLETMVSIFNPMIDAVNGSEDPYRKNCTWDVRLALDYKDLHRRIISSVIKSCMEGLQQLENL